MIPAQSGGQAARSHCAPSVNPVRSREQAACSGWQHDPEGRQCNPSVIHRAGYVSQCVPSVIQCAPSVPQRASSAFPVCSNTNHPNQGGSWRCLAWLREAGTATTVLIKCQGFNCNGVNWCGFRRLSFNCSGFNATALSAEALIATPPGSSEAQGL